MNHTC